MDSFYLFYVIKQVCTLVVQQNDVVLSSVVLLKCFAEEETSLNVKLLCLNVYYEGNCCFNPLIVYNFIIMFLSSYIHTIYSDRIDVV